MRTRAIAAVLFACLIAPAARAQELEDTVRSFIQKQYVHGVPYAEARELGAPALSVLEKCLADEDFKPYWNNVVTTVGFIGEASGYPMLRHFVRDRFVGDVDITTFQALIAAQGILGHIAAFDAPDALADLEKGVDPAKWADLRWSYGNYRGEKLSLLWSKLTINALANSGQPSARPILERLQSSPYSEKQRSNVAEGLVRHSVIARKGLVAYEHERTLDNAQN